GGEFKPQQFNNFDYPTFGSYSFTNRFTNYALLTLLRAILASVSRRLTPRPQSKSSRSVPASTSVLAPKRRRLGRGPPPVPSRITFRFCAVTDSTDAVEDPLGFDC